MAIDWNAIYESKFAEGQKGYDEQTTYYNAAKAQEQAAMDAQLAANKAALDKSREGAMQQAYITKRMNERDMPALLAAQGLKGGVTESTASDIFRTYQNTRNAADTAHASELGNLNVNYATNTASLGSKYNQLLAELQQRRRDDAMAQAQFAYNAAMQEEQLKLQREQLQWERDQAASAYGGGGGGVTPSPEKSKTEPTGNYGVGPAFYIGQTSTESYVKPKSIKKTLPSSRSLFI